MPIVALNHFNIRVAENLLDTIRDFYVDVLGLSEGPRPPFPSKGYWLYAGGNPVLHLSITRGGECQGEAGPSTFDHVAFSCEDFDAMRNKLDAFGIDYRVAEVPLVAQRQIFLRDPTGNGLELNFLYQS